MSQWTQVAGCIRYEAFVDTDFNWRNEYMGVLTDNLPTGDEGGIKFKIVTHRDRTGICGCTVAIWGSLRDNDDIEAIETWFLKCLNPPSLFVRQGCLTINVQGKTHTTLTGLLKDDGSAVLVRSTLQEVRFPVQEA